MNKNLFYIFFLLVTASFMQSCVSATFHPYAETDFEKATEYIYRLENDTIVVACNTYKEEEDTYLGAIKYGSKDVEKNKKKLQKLRERREEEVLTTMRAFEEHFSFAKPLYMPDSLVHKFEDGEDGIFFYNLNGELDPSITYSNRSPIKLLQVGNDVEWVITEGKIIIANPFPNNYSYKNGLYVFLGLDTHERRITTVAKVFQNRLSRYVKNPSRKVYL